MEDILNDDKQFLSHNELKEKYSCRIDSLSYLGLINSILREWKYILRTRNSGKLDNKTGNFSTGKL